MSNYKLTFELQQYTPLLHFQWDTEGACLRASEVKPKLDRFVVDYLERNGVAPSELPKEWVQHDGKTDAHKDNPHIALRYKMRFEAKGEPDNNIRQSPIHPLYFGNQGEANKDKVKQVFYTKPIVMTIMLLSKAQLELPFLDSEKPYSLGDILKKLIPPFFALHSFGTRSNKGFGSFGVQGENVSFEDLSLFMPSWCSEIKIMKRNSGYSDVAKERFETQLDDIYVVSSMLKGGVKFLKITGAIQEPDPINGAKVLSEKKYILHNVFSTKEKNIYKHKIAGAEGRSELAGPLPLRSTFRFMRALLGLTDTYAFGTLTDSNIANGSAFTISVSDSETEQKNKISRFANPLVFKPMREYTLLIINKIPDKMWNHTFIFSGEDGEEHSLRTPSASEFNFQKFISTFCKNLNTFCNNLNRRTRGGIQIGGTGSITVRTEYPKKTLNYRNILSELTIQPIGGEIR